MEFARVVEKGRKPGVSEVANMKSQSQLAYESGRPRILLEWIRPEVKAVH